MYIYTYIYSLYIWENYAIIIFSVCYLHYNHIQIRCIKSSWYIFTCLNISIHPALHQPHFSTYAESWPRQNYLCNGPLARYANSRVAHAPGMPGTFSPPPTSKKTASWQSQHATRHVRHARAVMHVGIATPRWRGKRSRHSRRMHNSQFYVSVKRPMDILEFMSHAMPGGICSQAFYRHPRWHCSDSQTRYERDFPVLSFDTGNIFSLSQWVGCAFIWNGSIQSDADTI